MLSVCVCVCSPNLRHKFCPRENEKCKFYQEFLLVSFEKKNGNFPARPNWNSEEVYAKEEPNMINDSPQIHSIRLHTRTQYQEPDKK